MRRSRLLTLSLVMAIPAWPVPLLGDDVETLKHTTVAPERMRCHSRLSWKSHRE